MASDEGQRLLSRLEDFYADKVVFLTGASGFLGRMSLEKLLRATSVKKIYILLRAKKDKDSERRTEELFDSIVFERVRLDNADFRRKVTMIEGDCALPELGIKPEVRDVLVHEVDIILHWAATVKFDENLKTATNINVRAVRDLMRMAKSMPQLKAFLHVSTAFSNCVRETIGEQFYDTPVTGAGLIAMMDALEHKTVAKLTPILIEQWPNTYVFTKAVTERMIRDEGKGLPIGIVRPSMVLGSYQEPVPGWIDNVYGPTGTMIGMAIGVIRIMRTDLSCTAEIVPGDYVVNTTLAAIVEVNRNFNDQAQDETAIQEIPIYNIVSSAQKPITWQTYADLTRKHCVRIPSPKIIWHSIQLFTGNYFLYHIGIFFLHYVPAYCIDAIAMCIGRKPLMVKAYDKIHELISILYYFGTRSWRFENGNVQKLWQRMHPDDHKVYNFDMSVFDWDDYFQYYTRGGRQFILKDPLETVPAGRRKYLLLKTAHYVLCASLLFCFYKFCSWFFTFIYS